MPATLYGPDDLLEYNPQYKLLICRQCQYAIQKNALETHLLRHKIYSRKRQLLMLAISRLEITEPDLVPLPVHTSEPISCLPVLSGLRCNAPECHHLTVSAKRMKRHWTEVHTNIGLTPSSTSFASPAKLQTFFRGTKNRYFEVSSSSTALSHANISCDDNEEEENEEQDHNIVPETMSGPSLSPRAPSQSDNNPPLPEFSMEALTYFHHFTTRAYLVLPGTEGSHHSRLYWQNLVVDVALDRRWLMCGLLAISACHLAVLAGDATTKQSHSKQALRVASEFSTGLEQANSEAAGTVELVKKIGKQIHCLLQCAKWTSAESVSSLESIVLSDLPSIMSILQGCAVPDTELPFQPAESSSHDDQPGTRHKNNMPEEILDRLHTIPFRIAERLGRPKDPQDVIATLSAIDSMLKCCTISFASGSTDVAWEGVVAWLTMVPDHFNQMLLHRHPVALVLFAHWAAILVKRAESSGCWFVTGLAGHIVQLVTRHASVNAHPVFDLLGGLIPIMID